MGAGIDATQTRTAPSETACPRNDISSRRMAAPAWMNHSAIEEFQYASPELLAPLLEKHAIPSVPRHGHGTQTLRQCQLQKAFMKIALQARERNLRQQKYEENSSKITSRHRKSSYEQYLQSAADGTLRRLTTSTIRPPRRISQQKTESHGPKLEARTTMQMFYAEQMTETAKTEF